MWLYFLSVFTNVLPFISTPPPPSFNFISNDFVLNAAIVKTFKPSLIFPKKNFFFVLYLLMILIQSKIPLDNQIWLKMTNKNGQNHKAEEQNKRYGVLPTGYYFSKWSICTISVFIHFLRLPFLSLCLPRTHTHTLSLIISYANSPILSFYRSYTWQWHLHL